MSALTQLQRLAFVAAVGLGLVLTFLIPPFQKADENLHFLRAAGLATGTFVCGRTDQGTFAHYLPHSLATLPEKSFAKTIAGNPTVKFSLHTYWQLLTQPYDATPTNVPGACTLPTLIYVPLAIVMAIPIALHLNPLLIFYLGRLAHLGLGLGLFGMALSKAPSRARWLLLLILLFPMTLHQLSSFNKDALHISFGAVALALIFRGLSKPAQISLAELTGLFFSVAMVIVARPQFMLWGLLPLLLAKSTFRRHHFSLRTLVALFVTGLVMVLVLSLSFGTYSSKAELLNTAVPDPYVNPQAQLQFLQEYPLAIPNLIFTTYNTLTPFYFTSMVGQFGWLDYSLTWEVYYGFLLILGWLVWLKRETLPRLHGFKLLVLAAVIFGTLGSIFFAMYLYASPVGSSIVLGVQGRYFILLVPLIIWFLSQFDLSVKQFMSMAVGLLLIVILGTTIKRYYWYPDHYYPAESLGVPQHSTDTETWTFPVTQAERFVVTLDPSKTSTGLAFLVDHEHRQVGSPYQLTLFDEACQHQLRSTVINPAELPRKFAYTEVVVRPFTPPTTGRVCLEMKPYYSQVPVNKELQLVRRTDGEWIMVPLYLY